MLYIINYKEYFLYVVPTERLVLSLPEKKSKQTEIHSVMATMILF